MLSKPEKISIQQVAGVFLFYGQADSTLMCPLSAITMDQANPTLGCMLLFHGSFFGTKGKVIQEVTELVGNSFTVDSNYCRRGTIYLDQKEQ